MSTKVLYRFSLHVCSWIFLCLFISAVSPQTVVALDEPSPESVHTLDPMVVTATKTPVPASHLTSAVEVITAEDFKRRNIKTVTEASSTKIAGDLRRDAT